MQEREREGERERERERGREREREREGEGEREREREREPFGSSFSVFLFPPGPAPCKLGLVRSAVLPKVLTPVLRPSFVLFSHDFPFLVLYPLTFWTLVSYSNYLIDPYSESYDFSTSHYGCESWTINKV